MADYAITSVARRVVYTGSAGVGPYAFSFPVLVNTDIAVYKNTTLLTLTTDYTVTISGSTGQGSVTLVVAAVLADRITIVGARSIERSTDFVTGGDLFANTLNTELDSETIFIQQIAETAERGLKAPVTDPTTINMTLPFNTTRANKFLSFDADGNPTVNNAVGTYKGNWAASVAYIVYDIIKDTSTNNIFICLTAHTSSGSQPITTNADVAKWSLLVDAASATTSATNAAASASAASTSATASAASASTATTQATNSATSASTASTQASNASTSATAAAASAAAAAASADNFDDTYLGSFSSNPTLDNDGNALTTGDLYFNTVSNELRVYNGTIWQAAALSSASFLTVSNNLSDLASNSTARTNLGLGTVATESIVPVAKGGTGVTASTGTTAVVLSTSPTLVTPVLGVATATSVNKVALTAPATSATLTIADGKTLTASNSLTLAGTDATTMTFPATSATVAGLGIVQTFTAAQRGTITALTDGATITPDFAATNNYSVTLAGNRTLANPTNTTAGQSGSIFVSQDGTGSRTLAYGTNWDFAGGTAPTLSTAASSVDRIDYVVRTATSIHAVFTAAYS